MIIVNGREEFSSESEKRLREKDGIELDEDSGGLELEEFAI